MEIESDGLGFEKSEGGWELDTLYRKGLYKIG